MFELCVKMDFAAAHHLEGYPGDCARPHGHNFEVHAFVRSKGVDEIGMAVDFREFKKALKSIIDVWDHRDLNTLPDFQDKNSSAEMIAKLCFERLSEKFKDSHIKVSKVTIFENPRCSATYFLED